MLANGGWDLTLILLTWTIWRAPTNASKRRMGFNSTFKGLIPWRTKGNRWQFLPVIDTSWQVEKLGIEILNAVGSISEATLLITMDFFF